MGIYLRKSFSLGPIRLNLSRSGLGVSFGVKGARIGQGPRGAYINMGRGGVYYRKTLRSHSHESAQHQPLTPQAAVKSVTGELAEIESVDVSKMTATSAAGLLDEISRVYKYVDKYPFAIFLSIIILIALCFTNAPLWSYVLAMLLTIPLVIIARHVDVTEGTVILRYDLDQEATASYDELHRAFTKLSESQKIWHIIAQGDVANWKMSGGAKSAIKRSQIQAIFKAPRRVICNFATPQLKAGRQTLYFLPDNVLVLEGRRAGAVAYSDMTVDVGSTKFIEEESIPNDTVVIGKTWKYVNKDGGPDKRFKNNYELPVVEYGELYLKSKSGLNEMYNTSNVLAALGFRSAVEKMR